MCCVCAKILRIHFCKYVQSSMQLVEQIINNNYSRWHYNNYYVFLFFLCTKSFSCYYRFTMGKAVRPPTSPLRILPDSLSFCSQDVRLFVLWVSEYYDMILDCWFWPFRVFLAKSLKTVWSCFVWIKFQFNFKANSGDSRRELRMWLSLLLAGWEYHLEINYLPEKQTRRTKQKQ